MDVQIHVLLVLLLCTTVRVVAVVFVGEHHPLYLFLQGTPATAGARLMDTGFAN